MFTCLHWLYNRIFRELDHDKVFQLLQIGFISFIDCLIWKQSKIHDSHPDIGKFLHLSYDHYPFIIYVGKKNTCIFVSLLI